VIKHWDTGIKHWDIRKVEIPSENPSYLALLLGKEVYSIADFAK